MNTGWYITSRMNRKRVKISALFLGILIIEPAGDISYNS